MRDKVGGIATGPPPPPEPILKWRQRAQPAEKFDSRCPGNRREMNPDKAAPSHGQEPAHDSEHNERDVKRYNQIGEEWIGYLRRIHVAWKISST